MKYIDKIKQGVDYIVPKVKTIAEIDVTEWERINIDSMKSPDFNQEMNRGLSDYQLRFGITSNTSVNRQKLAVWVESLRPMPRNTFDNRVMSLRHKIETAASVNSDQRPEMEENYPFFVFLGRDKNVDMIRTAMLNNQ